MVTEWAKWAGITGFYILWWWGVASFFVFIGCDPTHSFIGALGGMCCGEFALSHCNFGER